MILGLHDETVEELRFMQRHVYKDTFINIQYIQYSFEDLFTVFCKEIFTNAGNVMYSIYCFWDVQ